ncbi:MAG: Flp pilus assembly complex ATPase component TadA [Planctomycetaceae bacterium]|nr:Flp pilus assembly complex ATPase component TadA [Planctomycetaceae bacterium]
MSQELGDLLVRSGVLSQEQLRDAQVQARGGQNLAEVLVRMGQADESTVWRAVAKLHNLPFVDLTKGRIAPEVLERIPSDFAVAQGLLPVLEKGGKLVVAIDEPLKRIVVDQLQFQLGTDVACAVAAPTALRRAIEQAYGTAPEESVARSMGAAEGGEEGDDAPIIRLVTRMFQDALSMRASDIHVEPGQSALRVRYRVDGVLRIVAEHPPHLAAPLVSRLKIMAAMDIAEKRKPQDGRIGLELKGRHVDVRCSILPTNHGESVVMRLLDRSANLIGLKELGFEEDDYKWFRRVISRPNGIVLVTGPTGSGKTTTLYAALGELNRPDVKIITAEDPVEYHIKGINQVQVTPRIGLSFARVLKAMLRSAPNVILVGEIRDLETAEIAIQASLTGHLVFSTLHTNDAASALTRLVDMGVKPFLVSAAVQAVMAQRLVRKLCSCATSAQATEAELLALGLDPKVYGDRKLRHPKGCRDCEGSGYRGRVGLFELLELDDVLRELTFRGASLEEVRATALSSRRLQPLLADGARKVLAGSTTVTEVLRVTRAGNERR